MPDEGREEDGRMSPMARSVQVASVERLQAGEDREGERKGLGERKPKARRTSGGTSRNASLSSFSVLSLVHTVVRISPC
jgi:hypothetical protein